MNNFDKNVFGRMGDGMRNAWKNFKGFLDQYDAEAWPPFLIFLAVVTLGMFMNFEAFQTVMGIIPSLVIAIFFEAAILAWKLTSNRKRNSADQNWMSILATWLSVALAIGMLVVNMFRIGGDQNLQAIAFVIVGIAALLQVVFYLLFSQSDPDLRIDREHKQNERAQKRKEQEVGNVLAELDGDVKIMQTIVLRLQEVQESSRGLPTVVRENLLNAARQRLLKQFNIKDLDKALAMTDEHVDLNRDGKIGGAEPLAPPSVGVNNTVANQKPARPDHPTRGIDLEELKAHSVDELFDDEPTELPTVPTQQEPPSQEADDHPF